VTGQYQIVEVIGTATCLWKNMLRLERKVENGLWGMTVFTAIHRTFGHNRI
jgi:hypothetical protein